MGQHGAARAVELDPGWQPDHLRTYPRELRDGDGPRKKLQEIAAKDFGGKPELRHQRAGVFRKGSRARDDVGEGR